MFAALKYRLNRAARRTALSGLALILLMAGGGLLTLAAWLALSAANGPVFASLILGIAYAGAGAVLMALAAGRAPPPPPQPETPWLALAEAFLGGFERGRDIRVRR